jgi:hypothetical protein
MGCGDSTYTTMIVQKSPMSFWLPCGLHGLAVPITVTVTVTAKAALSDSPTPL